MTYRLLCAALLGFLGFLVHNLDAADLGDLPVLHAGRIKPFAVAAEESVLAVAGKTPFGTVDLATRKIIKKTPSTVLVAAWLLDPQGWNRQPIVHVPWHALQQKLGLPGQWASPAELDAQRNLLQEAADRDQHSRQSGEAIVWTRDDEATLATARRLATTIEVLAGRTIALAPLCPDAASRAWVLETVAQTLPELEHGESERPWRMQVRAALAGSAAGRDDALMRADPWLTVEDVALRPDSVLLALTAIPGVKPMPPALAELLAAGPAWAKALRGEGDPVATTTRLEAACRALGEARDHALAARDAHNPQGSYPSPGMLALEQNYYRARPFTWAWILFLAGGLVAVFAGARRWQARLGLICTVLAMLVTTAGLAARVTITGLGAVTNLYETLIYVALISAGLGLWLSRSTGKSLYAITGGVGAALCAMVGEAMPPELGSSIGQLQPVLRSRFWLWIHVKVVVASYAPFVLAWVLGNVALWQAWRRREAVSAELGKALYRCLQIGTVLIAAGTLLGAVWADEAWGRFWGWDPKEVGALLILLTYLVPLHLRYVGAVSHTGLAAWSVLGIISVVWSWYGVNFIQATGLHAYAFGSASRVDQLVVGAAVAGQVALTTYQLLSLRRRNASSP